MHVYMCARWCVSTYMCSRSLLRPKCCSASLSLTQGVFFPQMVSSCWWVFPPQQISVSQISIITPHAPPHPHRHHYIARRDGDHSSPAFIRVRERTALRNALHRRLNSHSRRLRAGPRGGDRSVPPAASPCVRPWASADGWHGLSLSS